MSGVHKARVWALDVALHGVVSQHETRESLSSVCHQWNGPREEGGKSITSV